MPSRDIKDCCTHLQKAWPLIKGEFETQLLGWEISLECTHRTPEEQFQLYQQGRNINIKTNKWEITDSTQIVTNCDGTNKVSKHNFYPAQAFDIKLRTPGRDITYKLRDKATGFVYDHWALLPVLAEKHDLVNGGVWKMLQDWPHFQCTKCDEAIH